jgi:site-specific recombinase XerD
MAVNFKDEAPKIVKDFLFYMQTIKEKSPKTVSEYYLDLRMFLRFIKVLRGTAHTEEFNKIKIDDIDIDFIKSITLSDIYEFMNYLISERNMKPAGRSRKASTIRSFFKYLTVKKHLLDIDPSKELEMPKQKKALPKYLTLEQSIELLNAVEGKNKERDYCILTIFLNCGLRLSELVGLNVTDIRSDNTARVVGKGNKERIIYLNDACIASVKAYLEVRPVDGVKDKKALFLSSQLKRISPKTVQAMVYKYLEKIGLDSQGYSCHKLRHTAATLMYQHGNVDVRVLKDILGHENLGTTEIYTHLSNQQLEQASKSNPLAKIKPKKKNPQ